MSKTINVLFSIFFAIAIGVHIYYVVENDGKPFWWHGLYFISYAVCWLMLFSTHSHRKYIYAAIAIFPFITHLFYAYQNFATLNTSFWICILVCIILPLGFLWIKKATV